MADREKGHTMTSRKSISIRIAVIAVLAATLGVGFAGPASAQTIYTAYAHQTSVDPVNGGTISFPGALNCAPVRVAVTFSVLLLKLP